MCPELGSLCPRVSLARRCSPHPLILGVLLGRLVTTRFSSGLGQPEARGLASVQVSCQVLLASWQVCGREDTFNCAELAHWVKGDVIIPSQPWQRLKSVCCPGERERFSSIGQGCFWSSQVSSVPKKLNQGFAAGWGLPTYPYFVLRVPWHLPRH